MRLRTRSSSAPTEGGLSFLSTAWFDAVRTLTRGERIPAPFSDTAHVDLVIDEGTDRTELQVVFKGGMLSWDEGSSPAPDLTLFLTPAVAYALLVEGSRTAGEDALYAGGLRTVGDSGLLRALRGYRFWCESDRVRARLRELTQAPVRHSE